MFSQQAPRGRCDGHDYTRDFLLWRAYICAFWIELWTPPLQMNFQLHCLHRSFAFLVSETDRVILCRFVSNQIHLWFSHPHGNRPTNQYQECVYSCVKFSIFVMMAFLLFWSYCLLSWRSFVSLIVWWNRVGKYLRRYVAAGVVYVFTYSSQSPRHRPGTYA